MSAFDQGRNGASSWNSLLHEALVGDLRQVLGRLDERRAAVGVDGVVAGVDAEGDGVGALGDGDTGGDRSAKMALRLATTVGRIDSSV